MNKLATAIAAIALIGTPALAADMPVKAPPPPAPVYSWTGWYVGGNVGGSWGNAKTNLTENSSLTTFTPAGDLPSSFALADSNTAKLNGVIGGGQVGYNYQFSPNWVLGFEADIQGSGERGNGQFADPVAPLFCNRVNANGSTCIQFLPVSGTALSSYQAKIDWFGTVRGRLGFLVADQLLFYATGGLAYGRVAVSGNTNLSATIINSRGEAFPFTPATTAFGASRTNVGFSVGAGMEGRFWLPSNWTWKVEYLYLDLGSLDTATSFALVPTPPVFVSPLAGTITTHTHFTDNIVRVGLNYQFH